MLSGHLTARQEEVTFLRDPELETSVHKLVYLNHRKLSFVAFFGSDQNVPEVVCGLQL